MQISSKGKVMVMTDEDNDCNEDATGDGGSIKYLVSSLIRGAIHGEITGANNEEPNEQAKAFFKLLKEVEKELYPGCKEVSRSEIVPMLFFLSRCILLAS
jgi:hypothetical protein